MQPRERGAANAKQEERKEAFLIGVCFMTMT